MSGMLDLSGADTSGFEALPSATYEAEVFDVEPKETKGKTEQNPNAKLPAGVPMWNVQFRITEDGYENRRVFRQYVIAPAKIDGKKYENKDKMDGALVRFLTAIGYDEETVMGGKWEPDFDDFNGRACRVVVKKKIKYGTKPEDNEFDNEVVGVKPPSDGTSDTSDLL